MTIRMDCDGTFIAHFKTDFNNFTIALKTRHTKKVDGGAPFSDEGKTREIAAKEAGFESSRSYEMAKRVQELGAQELIDILDDKVVSITDAAAICNDGGRFLRVMRGVVGKRLTYRRLCCIDGAGFMGLE